MVWRVILFVDGHHVRNIHGESAQLLMWDNRLDPLFGNVFVVFVAVTLFSHIEVEVACICYNLEEVAILNFSLVKCSAASAQVVEQVADALSTTKENQHLRET